MIQPPWPNLIPDRWRSVNLWVRVTRTHHPKKGTTWITWFSFHLRRYFSNYPNYLLEKRLDITDLWTTWMFCWAFNRTTHPWGFWTPAPSKWCCCAHPENFLRCYPRPHRLSFKRLSFDVASQPTRVGNSRPHHQGLLTSGFPQKRPAIKPLFLRGRYVRG